MTPEQLGAAARHEKRRTVLGKAKEASDSRASFRQGVPCTATEKAHATEDASSQLDKKSGGERLALKGKCSSDEKCLHFDGGRLFSSKRCEPQLDKKSGGD